MRSVRYRAGAKALVHRRPCFEPSRSKRRQQVLELVMRARGTSASGRRWRRNIWQPTRPGSAARNTRRWMLAASVEPPSQAPTASHPAPTQSALRPDSTRRFAPPLAERGPKACLMNFVDDATGVALCRFSDRKRPGPRPICSQPGYVNTALGVVLRWKNVYQRQPTSREALAGIKPETQFGRMCAKPALRSWRSPQAKGRVERHHGTHQDRLIKKMRLRGIVEYEADRYLDEECWPSTTSASPVGGGRGLSPGAPPRHRAARRVLLRVRTRGEATTVSRSS